MKATWLSEGLGTRLGYL